MHRSTDSELLGNLFFNIVSDTRDNLRGIGCKPQNVNVTIHQQNICYLTR
jgi:hypothetical protein